MSHSPPAILFEDAEALVIDKPAGLAVSRPRAGGASLDDMLPALRLGFARLPVAAHRLDQDTSGCLLLARNPKALRRFGGAFAEGRVAKCYLALLDGDPGRDSGRIDLPLAKVSSREAGWRIRADPKGQSARTDWQRLAAVDGRALLLFRPATGRTHQLRVHAAEGLGVPISGDPVYGRASPGGLMLHAWRLEVPRAGKAPVAAEAPLPPRFLAAGVQPEMLDAAA